MFRFKFLFFNYVPSKSIHTNIDYDPVFLQRFDLIVIVAFSNRSFHVVDGNGILISS